MMFIERAEIPVKDGMEKEFATVMAGKPRTILLNAPGCASVRFGRGVENPGKFILLIEWETVEAHTALTTTPEFAEFRALVGPFFAGAPSMEHFDLG